MKVVGGFWCLVHSDSRVSSLTEFCSDTIMLIWFLAKTSPKGFSASKCDEGNWIFSKYWIFFGNFLGFFLEFLIFFWFFLDFLGNFWDFFGNSFCQWLFTFLKVNWFLTFSKSADCWHWKNQLIVYIVKINWFFTF